MKRQITKVFAAVLACIMLLAALPLSVSAVDTATVNGKEINVGETVTYKYLVTTDTPVVNAQFEITYPSDILEVVEEANNVAFPAFEDINCVSNYTAGKIHVNATNASTDDNDLYDFSAGAYVCSVKFKVIAAGTGAVTIDFDTFGGKNTSGIAGDEIELITGITPASGVTVSESLALVSTAATINGESARVGNIIAYTYNFSLDNAIVDVQAKLMYSSEILRLVSVEYPILTNVVDNKDIAGEVNYAVTNPQIPFDFSAEDAVLVTATFEVIASGDGTITNTIEYMNAQDPNNTATDIPVFENSTKVDTNAVTTESTVVSVITHTVTFVTDGTPVDAMIVEVDTAIGILPKTSKEGYTFTGWFLPNGTQVTPSTIVTGDLILTARFTINTCTVTFATDGGSAVAPITANYGTTITLPTAPTKENHTFAGWYTADGAQFTESTVVTGDITLTARWNANNATVTFVSDNATTDTQSVAIGSTVTTLPTPEKADYVFSGWYTSDDSVFNADTVVTEDITVTAKWIRLGDVNFDEKIDSADAILALQHYAGLIVLDDNALIAADVNLDKAIVAADAILILQYYANLITTFA